MPRISPPGGAVDWPAAEGALGVVGLAPWATLDFCRVLYAAVAASKDWHYPRLLLDINTKLPSRGRHLQLGETDPSATIAATIAELAAQGATLAVVPSNTAHILYERWAANASIPVLDIIEETLRFAVTLGANHAAALVSASMAEHDLYARRAQTLGLPCTRLGRAEQGIVAELIAAIKVSGTIDAVGERAARGLLEPLKAHGVDTIIAGCTELSSLDRVCAQVGMRFVDSNVALARAALVRLGVTRQTVPTPQGL